MVTTKIIEKNCNNCRFNRDLPSYTPAGGDCINCINYNEWRPFKRVIPTKCATCLLRNDPCHCDCVDCQDASNWRDDKCVITFTVGKRRYRIETTQKEGQI